MYVCHGYASFHWWINFIFCTNIDVWLPAKVEVTLSSIFTSFTNVVPALVTLVWDKSPMAEVYSCGQLDLSDCYLQKLKKALVVINCTCPFVVCNVYKYPCIIICNGVSITTAFLHSSRLRQLHLSYYFDYRLQEVYFTLFTGGGQWTFDGHINSPYLILSRIPWVGILILLYCESTMWASVIIVK